MLFKRFYFSALTLTQISLRSVIPLPKGEGSRLQPAFYEESLHLPPSYPSPSGERDKFSSLRRKFEGLPSPPASLPQGEGSRLSSGG